MPTLASRLDRAIAALPQTYPGPGGACAVVHNGEILARHAWGYANAERRLPFTPQTLFRICSNTKQFTCGLVLDAFPDPTILDTTVAARLPRLTGATPTTLDLCHNQSGLRDYWALAMLHGSPAEAPFGEREAQRIIQGVQTLHFTPGTRYSYTNQNFRILSDIIEARTGRSFAENLRHRIFARAGMETAFLAADTTAMPDGTQGYEGKKETGFVPAINRILWTGDAGIGASLDDMIAWERHIDATRNDPTALYQRLSAPVTFADGTPAVYGFGLGRRPALGRAVTGHGGALRGWRSHRMVLPAERLSVVVFFNHLSDAQDAAMALLRAVLDETAKPRAPFPAPDWLGAYLDPETGLSARIDAAPDGQTRLRFGHSAETLDVQEDGSAASDSTTLRQTAEGLRMHRMHENQSSVLQILPPPDAPPPEGQYACAELGAALTITHAGGVPHGAFSGFLGAGRMEALMPIARNVWALPCPRALDHTPPGDWTLRLLDSGDMEVGCWLARRLMYRRGLSGEGLLF
jgi:D-aminopeptidase